MSIRVELGYGSPTNASYPWKTEDHTLGFWSHISVNSSSLFKAPTYHENFVKDGSSYRLHSPYELPYYKTNEHIGQINVETQFLVTPQISMLGETLLGESIERCDNF